MSASKVRKTWICFYQCRFNFKCSLLIFNAMPMDDMHNIETSIDDFLNRSALISEFIVIAWVDSILGVFKNSITLSLAHIECLTSAWIYESIDVVSELVVNFRWK